MKKITIILLFLSTGLHAQLIETGDKRRDWGWYQQSLGKTINFFGFSTERAVADNVTMGFSLMVSNPGGFDFLNVLFVPTLKGNYYFNDLLNIDNDNLDLYAGLGVSKVLNLQEGYYSERKEEYVDGIGLVNDYPVGVQFNAGARYFLGGNFGFKGELGLGSSGISTASLGLFISRKK